MATALSLVSEKSSPRSGAMTIPVDKGAAPPRHHVQLVPGMGGLLVCPARGVVLHHHGPVGQNLDRALAFRDGECRSLLDRRPPPLDLRMRFVQRRPSSLWPHDPLGAHEV